MFIPFPPESDARASGPQGEGFLYTRTVTPGGKGPGLGAAWSRGPPPQPQNLALPHPPAVRDPSPTLSQALVPNTSQRPRLRVARPASRTPAPPRPAPPCLPSRGPPPERVRAHPRAGRSARPARGAPFAPSTYLWRPRPARAARSPTTIGRPSRPGRRRQPERPPRLSRVGRTRLPRGRAEGGPWRCTANPWARPLRIGESAERAEELANRRRRALEASACSPIARRRRRDQKLRPRPR